MKQSRIGSFVFFNVHPLRHNVVTAMFLLSSAILKPSSVMTKFSFICLIASSEISSPNSFSASANLASLRIRYCPAIVRGCSLLGLQLTPYRGSWSYTKDGFHFRACGEEILATVHNQLSREYCGSRWGDCTGQSLTGFEKAQVLTCMTRSQIRLLRIVGRHFRYCAKSTRLSLDVLIVNGCGQKKSGVQFDEVYFSADERTSTCSLNGVQVSRRKIHVICSTKRLIDFDQ